MGTVSEEKPFGCLYSFFGIFYLINTFLWYTFKSRLPRNAHDRFIACLQGKYPIPKSLRDKLSYEDGELIYKGQRWVLTEYSSTKRMELSITFKLNSATQSHLHIFTIVTWCRPLRENLEYFMSFADYKPESTFKPLLFRTEE